MIAYLQGICAEMETDRIIVDVGGVGYGVYVSASTLQKAPGIGEAVTLHTYLSVREDAMTLYGFLSREELRIFKLLITVSGVGPKGALSVLSTLSADDLRFAILTSDIKTISASPGIGKKTAERMVLELKDKFADDDLLVSYRAQEGDSAGVLALAQEEAVLALCALGYAQSQAMKAVRKVAADHGEDTEEILKAALKELV